MVFFSGETQVMQVKYFGPEKGVVVVVMIMGVGLRCFCRGLLKKLDILPVPYLYKYTL
jgi:hypothetical protein